MEHPKNPFEGLLIEDIKDEHIEQQPLKKEEPRKLEKKKKRNHKYVKK
jgi:hypothetical protein